MPTVVNIANVGSPADDPGLLLPGKLFVPGTAQPWPCIVGTIAGRFQNGGYLTTVMNDLATAGYLCLSTSVRLMTNPLSGQTTDGKWHQQTDDYKIAVRAMRSNPFGLGYNVTGFVGSVAGSGAGHHSLYAALDGTSGDDKTDASVCLSPVTDLSNRNSDVSGADATIFATYGRTTDLPTLLARSPISLNLASAKTILHYNGDNEQMGLSMLTLFRTAILAAGVTNYTSVVNTGVLGTKHAIEMWPDVKNDVIMWLNDVVTTFSTVNNSPVINSSMTSFGFSRGVFSRTEPKEYRTYRSY